jgi:hypothetical protein
MSSFLNPLWKWLYIDFKFALFKMRAKKSAFLLQKRGF